MQGSFHAARFLVLCFHLPEARHLRFKHSPGSAQELVQMLAQVVVHGAKELPFWLPLIPGEGGLVCTVSRKREEGYDVHKSSAREVF